MKITSVQLVSLLVVLLVGCAQPADKQEESGEASSSEIDAALNLRSILKKTTPLTSK